MNGPKITATGNATADAELRYTHGGKAVTSFTLAVTPRKKAAGGGDWEDGTSMFLRVSVWDAVAENVASSILKGTRVIVTGELERQEYTDKEGNQRDSWGIVNVDSIGPDLRFATAQVTRATAGGLRAQQAPEQNAWATPGYTEETPW